MKAYSGILFIKTPALCAGSARIDFRQFPYSRPADLGDANLSICDQATTGGAGAFHEKPACLVHFRELVWLGSGQRSICRCKIDFEVDHQVLEIRWQMNGIRSEVREIGFLVVGE